MKINHRFHLHRMSVAVLALASSGMASAQTVRDSAGIRIVMNDKPTWTAAQRLQLSATPTLVIGGPAGDPQSLKSVRGAFYLSDGRIVVGERLSSELRVYDGSGKYQTTIGRKGDAPGQFKEFGSVVRLAGDTIAVLHDRASISRFSAAGTFVSRSSDRPAVQIGRPTVITDVMVVLNGGSRVNVMWPLDHPVGPIGSRFDAKGTVEVVRGDSVSTKKPGQLSLMQASADKNGLTKPWLGAEAVYTGNGSQFVIGYGTSYSLTRYSSEGIPNLIVRRAWKPTPVSGKDWEDWTDEWLKRWTKDTGAALAKQRQDLLDDDYMDVLPAFSAVVLDNTGKLWVRAPKTIDGAVAGSLKDFPIGPSTWSVFSNVGIWLGDVVMPSKFEPTDIGADYVLGIAREGEVSPVVVRYKLGPK